MRPNLAKGSIRPKISTMPRQKTEAAAFLDVYKLVVEKKRLQQELQTMEERRKLISDRLVIIDRCVAELEQSVQQMREVEASTSNNSVDTSATRYRNLSMPVPENFETLFLEY